MNKKLYLLGIDGLSYEYIEKYLKDLPNLKSLFQKGNCKKLGTIFPPDSIPAWISIFTGFTPAEHGVLDSIDYLDKKNCKAPTTKAFKGHTFWDYLTKKEKKVCIINPFMAFPVWDVNGFFVNGSVFSSEKNIDANDKELLKKYKVPNLGGFTTFPQKAELDQFIKDNVQETKDLEHYAKLLHEHDDYDLFFVTYFMMDRYQHFLWRYSDEGDITHPKNNLFKTSILDFYKLYDEMIGNVKAELRKDESLVIVSDHGFGRRCTKIININEILRKRNYYFVETKKIKVFDKKYLIEKLKNIVTDVVFKFDLEDLFYKLVKLVPNRKAIKQGKHLKSNKNIAEACTMFGTNFWGGIKINKDNIPFDRTYEEIRQEIIELFENYTYKGKKLFKWLKKREEIYDGGKNVEKYADILFMLDSEYGVNWAIFTKEISFNFTHKKISGGHNQAGCFFTYNLDKKLFDQVDSILDINNLVKNFYKS